MDTRSTNLPNRLEIALMGKLFLKNPSVILTAQAFTVSAASQLINGRRAESRARLWRLVKEELMSTTSSGRTTENMTITKIATRIKIKATANV